MTLLLELKKIFMNKRNICIICVVFIIKVLLCISTYSNPDLNIQCYSGEFNRRIYKEYMKEFNGEFTTEKYDKLTKEYNDCVRVIEEYNSVEENYKLGIISKREYEQYSNNYYECIKKSATLEYINKKCEYMYNLNEKQEFSYDIELETYLNNKQIDYLLIILIVFIFTKFFTEDYYCGFNNMVISTKKGRNKLFKAKLLSTILVSLIIGLVYQLLDTGIALTLIDFDRIDIGMLNMMELSGCFDNISVPLYIVISILCRTFFTVVLGIIVMFVSVMLKNNIFVYGTVIAYICLPWYVYVYLGNLTRDISLAQGLNARESLCDAHQICGINNSLFSVLVYLMVIICMIFGAYKVNQKA